MAMIPRDRDACLLRAEFYLCLARAFLPPMAAGDYEALRGPLAEDLGELCAALGGLPADAVEAYRRGIASCADREALMRLYSRLFSAPPRAVHLGASAYLDGVPMGGSVGAMEAAYRRCGIERSEDFRSPSDHLSVQFEFVAFLYAALAAHAAGERPQPPAVAPEEFLGVFAARWLPAFVAGLERASGEMAPAGNPYLPLARLLEAAVARDAIVPEEDRRGARAARAIRRAREKQARQGLTAEVLRDIERKLKARGLATDHLAVPPELRDARRGLTAKTSPEARRRPRLPR